MKLLSIYNVHSGQIIEIRHICLCVCVACDIDRRNIANTDIKCKLKFLSEIIDSLNRTSLDNSGKNVVGFIPLFFDSVRIVAFIYTQHPVKLSKTEPALTLAWN